MAKSNIIASKNVLYQCVTDQFLFNDILSTAEEYGLEVKCQYKYHFQKKIDWILTKYYPSTPPPRIPPPSVPPVDRVTVLSLDSDNPINLTDDERQLLSLGPKFAVTPIINEDLLHRVQVDVAECAYKLKWNRHIEEGNGNTATNVQTSAAAPSPEPEPEPEVQDTRIPFKSPFATPPPNQNIILEAELSLLNKYILDTYKSVKLKCNLSRAEMAGLKSLSARTDIHISKSDKCGDFVVSQRDSYREITLHHINSNPDVYKYLPPKRKDKGLLVEVRRPTETSFRNQINTTCDELQTKANTLWSEIARAHDFSSKFTNVFFSHHCTLPTLYTLVKTHKIPIDVDPSTLTVEGIKARPIVSCCGSPTEKMAWLISHCIKPLLKHVPCHLFNIHSHLELLRALPPEELADLSFYSADISALYTNLNIDYCIDAVISMAEEYWEELSTFDITLVELHKLLDLVFKNSFFTFDQKLYWQGEGLFMGCSPSPGAAVIGVYRMEKNSIYVDTFYISSPVSLYYTRYMDDNSSLARNQEYAEQICRMIGEQDPNGRIQWEIDFPTPGNFVPFLDTEVKIEPDGTLVSRYYRKPQNKGIILHSKSHHPLTTKVEVLKNFYKTAQEVSSGHDEREHSYRIVDDLARKNGYRPQRPPTHHTTSRRRNPSSSYKAPLKLPYVSEEVSSKIRTYIKKKKLAVRPIFTPGQTLSQRFCQSRPLDKRICTLGNSRNCKICPLITNGTCAQRNLIYRVDCKLCQDFYEGETYRPCHDRFSEHIRAANNPRSYPNNSIGKHYAECHVNCVSNVSFTILDRQSSTARRKISEAIMISRHEPKLNAREELVETMKFMLH